MLRASRIQTRPVEQTAARMLSTVMISPVGGWASDASIAKDNPGAAEVMENFIPTTKGVRARGGSLTHATLGIRPVETLMTYEGATQKKMFAASDGSIFDVTAPLSAFTTLTADRTGMTGDVYSWINFANGGGEYLLAFNGVDLHLVYDGATWASNTPAITGVSTADINQVWSHGNRVWMVKKDSKTAHYLGVDAISGAVSTFSLQGVFQKGGKLLFGASWSQDSGSGSADRCVFVSDQGEVAVYGGTDPSTASDWQIFGVYNIAPPLGRFAFEKVGGDLLIMTVNGIVPMSEVVAKDPAALTATSVTRFIEPDWKEATAQQRTKEWQFLKWDDANLGIVSVPSDTQTVSGSSVWGSTFVWGVTPWGDGWTIEVPTATPRCFLVNLQTGRWCLIKGWDCRSMAVFNGQFYFGTSIGQVVQGDRGGSDQGKPYECRLAFWPSRFDYVGLKQFLQASAAFEHSTSFNPVVSMSVDNALSWKNTPDFPQEDGLASLWDTALWDNPDSVWDAKSEKRVRTTKWTSLNRKGRVGAVMLQMAFNNSTTPDVEFTDVTLTYERGSVVN